MPFLRNFLVMFLVLSMTVTSTASVFASTVVVYTDEAGVEHTSVIGTDESVVENTDVTSVDTAVSGTDESVVENTDVTSVDTAVSDTDESVVENTDVTSGDTSVIDTDEAGVISKDTSGGVAIQPIDYKLVTPTNPSVSNKPSVQKNTTDVSYSLSNPSKRVDTRKVDPMSKERLVPENMKVKNITKEKNLEDKEYVSGEVLVKFKRDSINLDDKSSQKKVSLFGKNESLTTKTFVVDSNIVVMKTNKNESVESLIARLKGDSRVEYVEPNYIRKITGTIPNDILFKELWGMHNTGQSVRNVTGKVDADIDLPEALELEGKNEKVIVAILDTGVAYDHPDLVDRMWDGSSCKNDKGVVVGGCIHGYDFEANDNNPYDESGHGTHVAGTIGATGFNNKGVIGVNPNAVIMAIKAGSFYFTSESIINGVNFARHNGARVINASLGGYGTDSGAERDAIKAFTDAGGLFVAAAGNDDNNNDEGVGFYPCNYNMDGIICVAATDQEDNRASFSSYGATSVDVAAPGVSVVSTVPGNDYGSVIFETFESVTVPSLPSGYVAQGTTGTYTHPDTAWSNVAIGDLSMPYKPNTITSFTSPTLNLTSYKDAYFSFWTRCDTEYDKDKLTDYMELSWTNKDGSLVNQVRFDEYFLDMMYGADFDATDDAIGYLSFGINPEYLNSNFQFKFTWVANDNQLVGNGCMVDDISVSGRIDKNVENYDYYSGTSMATPHVTGLASLIWRTNPELKAGDIKSTILNTGDSLDSLKGKIVSGKRINAFNAVKKVKDDMFTPPSGGGGGGSGTIDGSRIPPQAPVDGFKVIINNGAQVTNDKQVVLTFNVGSDVTKIALSDDEKFENVGLRDFVQNIQWNLKDGFGTKKVYAKFYNRFGHGTDSVIGTIEYRSKDAVTDEQNRILNESLKPGVLLKRKGHSAVYYYGNDHKRHLFVNEKIFYSWYKANDFKNVLVLNDSELAEIKLGFPIRFRPGTLVKEKSSPKVYVVGEKGVLHGIGSVDIANGLYGSEWKNMVRDMGASEMTLYTVGTSFDEVNSALKEFVSMRLTMMGIEV